MTHVRVLICEDSAVYAAGLRRALEYDRDITVIGVSPTAEEALAALASERPDLVTMDLELPGMDGLIAVEEIMSSPAGAGGRAVQPCRAGRGESRGRARRRGGGRLGQERPGPGRSGRGHRGRVPGPDPGPGPGPGHPSPAGPAQAGPQRTGAGLPAGLGHRDLRVHRRPAGAVPRAQLAAAELRHPPAAGPAHGARLYRGPGPLAGPERRHRGDDGRRPAAAGGRRLGGARGRAPVPGRRRPAGAGPRFAQRAAPAVCGCPADQHRGPRRAGRRRGRAHRHGPRRGGRGRGRAPGRRAGDRPGRAVLGGVRHAQGRHRAGRRPGAAAVRHRGHAGPPGSPAAARGGPRADRGRRAWPRTAPGRRP